MLKQVLLFGLILCLSIESQAQNQGIKYTKISGTNDIIVGKINDIHQDKYGFFWLLDQTYNSLIQYDGNTMVKYELGENNPYGFQGTTPECLVTDSTGSVWLGYFNDGLDYFNPYFNSVTNYRHDPKDSTSLGGNSVSVLLIDGRGDLWVGTNAGVSHLESDKGTFRNYRYDLEDTTSLSHNFVRSLYEDRDGTIWVGTGFEFSRKEGGGLNRFDRKTGTFTRYLHDPDDPRSLVDDKVRAIFEDSSGNFWVGTRKDGLHTLDRETGEFTRHSYDPEQPDKLSRPPAVGWFDATTFILEDTEGQIWIGTNNNGVNRYDPVAERVRKLGDNTDDFGNFITNSAWSAHLAYDGQIWISSQQSTLHRIDINYSTFPRSDQPANTFYEESESVFWFGTNEGAIRIDELNGTTEVMTHNPFESNSLSSDVVESISQDRDGLVWIGTGVGLNRYDPATKKYTRFLHDPENPSSLSHNQIVKVFKDSQSNLWIGTRGGGLNLWDSENEGFTHFVSTDSINSEEQIHSNWISSLDEDLEGNLWIGLSLGSLDRFNIETGKFTHYPMKGVLGVYFSQAGEIWAITTNGLVRYDEGSDAFLIEYDETLVKSITEDDHGNLWMGSSLGILNYDRELKKFRLFGKERGVEDLAFQTNGAYTRSNGHIYMGTFGGHYSFFPQSFSSGSRTSKVYFTDLWLEGETVSPGSDTPLDKPAIETSQISLNYNQNAFAFTINEVDFSSGGDKLISYKLENYDEEWRQAFSGSKAYYFNVPPGEYTLRAKAANNYDGKWEENSMGIVILPPWFFSWWAIASYIVVFIIGIYGTHRIQKANVVRKERERTKDRELEQAREIKKAYDQLEVAHTNLKSAQTQLIQSEKMASLGELTAGIAHEIQNPLNFVNNFSDVNKELLEELREEVKKGNEQEAKAIIKNIIENEEKILHHGKRADSIVKGMLQHSRAGGGEKEPTDINALCDEYLRLSYHGLRAKDKSFNADFKTELDPNLPKIHVVPQDIGRVLLNLINNAFFAVSAKTTLNNPEVLEGSKGGGPESHASLQNESVGQARTSGLVQSDYKPTVTVSTKHVPLGRGIEGEEKIQISIKDNGPGIPDLIKDKIFQPFFTTKATGQGTGLGLSLSYDIVTKGHNGELKVESEEGKGTEFLIILPS